MIGYPITYGDNLEYGNGFTSEAVITKASEYWTPENKIQFQRGYAFGAFIISLGAMALTPQAASAATTRTDGTITSNNGNCPAPGGAGNPTPTPKSVPAGSLANVPTADRGAYVASALGICGIAMKSGAFWVGFVCAGAVIVGVRMASVPANAAI